MIGKLIYGSDALPRVATLQDDLRWSSDDPSEAAKLSQQFPAESVEGMPDLVVGRHVLYQAAERLGGRVEVPKLHRTAARELV